MAVCPLLAILGLLTGRAAAMSARDILFLLGLGLHLALVGILALTTTAKADAILKNGLEIVLFTHAEANFSLFTLRKQIFHSSLFTFHLISDGTGAHP